MVPEEQRYHMSYSVGAPLCHALYVTGKEKRVEFLLNQALPNPLGPGHEWTHPHALVSL